MKKLFVLFGLVTLLSTGALFAKASGLETTDTATTDTTATDTATTGTTADATIDVNPGLTPDNPFYFLDKGWENFTLLFGSDEKKADRLLKYAEERMSELNALDDEKAKEYADSLYQDYGKKLDTANEKLAQLIAENKLSESELENVQEHVSHVSDVDKAVNESKKTHLSDEVEAKVQDIQTKAYAVSVATEMDQAKVQELHDKGYGYGEILKLQAIATLSGKTIDELTYLDVTTEDGEHKEVDFGKLATELGLDKEALLTQFKDYKDAARDAMKEQNDARRKEIEQERDQIRQDIQTKIDEILAEHQQDFLARIDELYNSKLEMINSLTDIDQATKDQITAKLDEIKQEIVATLQAEVENDEFSFQDFGKLTSEFNAKFNEVVQSLGISDSEVTDRLNDLEANVSTLLDQLFADYQARYNVTVDAAVLAQIKADMIASLQSDINDGDYLGIFRDLHEKVFEKLNEVTGINPDDFGGHSGDHQGDRDSTDPTDGDTSVTVPGSTGDATTTTTVDGTTSVSMTLPSLPSFTWPTASTNN